MGLIQRTAGCFPQSFGSSFTEACVAKQPAFVTHAHASPGGLFGAPNLKYISQIALQPPAPPVCSRQDAVLVVLIAGDLPGEPTPGGLGVQGLGLIVITLVVIWDDRTRETSKGAALELYFKDPAFICQQRIVCAVT